MSSRLFLCIHRSNGIVMCAGIVVALVASCSRDNQPAVADLTKLRSALASALSAKVIVTGYDPAGIVVHDCDVPIGKHGRSLESKLNVKYGPFSYPDPKISSQECIDVVLQLEGNEIVEFQLIGGMGLRFGPQKEYYAQLVDDREFEEEILALCNASNGTAPH